MQSKPRGQLLAPLTLMLIFSVAACGATPTANVGEATATPTATALEVQDVPASPTPIIPPTGTKAAPEAPPASPTPTPTVTPTPATGILLTPTAPASACAGLGGEIEVQVLVGPADAAGLEPVAVGKVPFSVASSEAPYRVQGAGPISYEAVLEREWGTYAVTLDLATTVNGECLGAGGEERLQLILEATGQQMVVVDAEGFHGEYPWSGTHTFELDLPLTDGATVTGEGYSFVLHLPGD